MTFVLYAEAAFAEIAGCFLFETWLRLGKSIRWLIPGCVSLVPFAWLLARVDTAASGRAYAAYGGIYVTAALL